MNQWLRSIGRLKTGEKDCMRPGSRRFVYQRRRFTGQLVLGRYIVCFQTLKWLSLSRGMEKVLKIKIAIQPRTTETCAHGITQKKWLLLNERIAAGAGSIPRQGILNLSGETRECRMR